jgi:hypothetical protein
LATLARSRSIATSTPKRQRLEAHDLGNRLWKRLIICSDEPGIWIRDGVCKSLDRRGILERIIGAWSSFSIIRDSNRGSEIWDLAMGIWVLLRMSRAVFIGVWRKVTFYDTSAVSGALHEANETAFLPVATISSC